MASSAGRSISPSTSAPITSLATSAKERPAKAAIWLGAKAGYVSGT